MSAVREDSPPNALAGLRYDRGARLKRMICLVGLVLHGCGRSGRTHATNPLAPMFPRCDSQAPSGDWPFFHGDRARTGSRDDTALMPVMVASGFDWIYDSEPFDQVSIGGGTYPPRLFASPLYVDRLTIRGGAHAGFSGPAVFAASSNGFVYAVAPCTQMGTSGDVRAGTILWRTRLGEAAVVPRLDGGIALGVLSTPALDLTAQPQRLYAASMDRVAGWQVFALDLSSGAVLPGWPIQLAPAAVAALDTNGPASMQPATATSQRGALNLSPDGKRLYVPFGTYFDGGVGWLVAVETATPALINSFSSARSNSTAASGGIWGAGGAAVDQSGKVFVTTGNAPAQSQTLDHVWGNSLLAFSPALDLAASYTPFNYCQLDAADIDVGGSSPALLAGLDPAWPELLVFGGKQGTVYLLSPDRMATGATHRPPCSSDSTTDTSLVPPQTQPQYGARGPLNVFGPYSDTVGGGDHAKMRSTPALLRNNSGVAVYVSGTTRASLSSTSAVPPSLARLRVQLTAGSPPYLALEGTDHELSFRNPGAPVVSSRGGADSIVWVVDANDSRFASLLDPNTQNPVLYAADGASLRVLYRSRPDLLNLGGKYVTALIARGMVVVGTDRLQVFGQRAP
jgi:hypothetical protein